VARIIEKKGKAANCVKKALALGAAMLAMAFVFLAATFFYLPSRTDAAGIKYGRHGVIAAELASSPAPDVSSDDVIASPPTL
jgi:hypothetical protein